MPSPMLGVRIRTSTWLPTATSEPALPGPTKGGVTLPKREESRYYVFNLRIRQLPPELPIPPPLLLSSAHLPFTYFSNQ